MDRIIMDETFVFDKNSKLMQDYLNYNTYLLDEFDIDFRVITTNSLEEINFFTNQRFSDLNSRSIQGRTILLVLNIAQDKARVEVSTALEHIFTDSFVSYVERKGIIPYFQDNRLEEGIFMLIELIKDTAMDSSLGLGSKKELKSKSIGAGAKTEAKIGQANPDAKKGKQISSSLDDSPSDVLQKYFHSLVTHNKNPNLEIYTKQTQDFFSARTVTDINQDNELRFTKGCNKGKYYYTHTHAALVQPLKPRTCAPYFFKKEEGSWKLDFYTMSKVLRFNTQMMWHFDMKTKPKYLQNYEIFFQNLRYDENGFPFYKQRKKLKWGFTCESWYAVGNEDKERCWISWLSEKGKAKNLLRLKIGDKIMRLGLSPQSLENPSIDNMMEYMKSANPGQKVSLSVLRDEELINLSTTLTQ